MSGGVDSSVVAYLLQHPRNNNDRYNVNSSVDVIGLHMSNWNALDEDAAAADVDVDVTNSNKSIMNKNTSNNNHGKTKIYIGIKIRFH